MFHGIQEDKDESWDTAERMVREFIQEELEIADDVLITRAHRLRNGKRNPPIIANFVLTSVRNNILYTSKRKVKDADNTKSRVTEDLTQRVREARRSLAPLYADALKKGLHPKIRHDKLLVDGKVFVYDNVNNVNVCILDKSRKSTPSGGSQPLQSPDDQVHVPLFTSDLTTGSQGESTLIWPSRLANNKKKTK